MKLRLIILAMFIVSSLSLVAPIAAQNEQFPCDLPTLQKAIDVYIEGLGKLKSGKETDVKKISNTLQEMANLANMLRATCDKLVFEGKSQKLIGPIEIPSGTYRATLATKGYGIVTVLASEGECGEGQYLDKIFGQYSFQY